MTTLRASLLLCLAVLPACEETDEPKVGESIASQDLKSGNDDVRGLAFDEVGSRLFVLDATPGEVYEYSVVDSGELAFAKKWSIPSSAGVTIPNVRGLGYAIEDGHEVFYVAGWDGSRSELWRWDATAGTADFADLRAAAFEIDDREILSLTCFEGDVFVSFDPSTYPTVDVQVRRGIVRLDVGRWSRVRNGKPAAVVRHLPGSGKSNGGRRAVSRGLATMEMDGATYLWGTIDSESVYCADAATGRGLFWVDRPFEPGYSLWGLAYGAGQLWLAERLSGADRIHRINVTQNVTLPILGPRRVRDLRMVVTSAPEAGTAEEDLGTVKHNFSHPYGELQMPNQGFDPATIAARDLSGVAGAVIEEVEWLPGNDVAYRQELTRVKYPDAEHRQYQSEFTVTYWSRQAKTCVYPHLADRNTGLIWGTDYVSDDADLYRLSDAASWSAFIGRVEAYAEATYGVPADMDNPYWAARNVLEYVKDHYYYPIDEEGRPATEDPSIGHFACNPANFKVALSDGPYDQDEIIACSSSSVVMAGAMRWLGIPARWIGSCHQDTEDANGDGETWDSDGDGFLDGDEAALAANGHRWAEVWLGHEYGWQRFDCTPSTPDVANGYSFLVAPPPQSQWVFMACAVGPVEAHQLVLNVGGGKQVEMFLDDEMFDGGNQRYNLQGRYGKPELWQSPGHRIEMRNALALDASVDAGLEVEVSWTKSGRWDLDPEAEVEVLLERYDDAKATLLESTVVGAHLDPDLGTFGFAVPAVAEGAPAGSWYRAVVRKVGDAETGDRTRWFERTQPVAVQRSATPLATPAILGR